MTEKYTPEKVAELVADTRDHADYMRRVWGDDAEVRDDSRLFDRLADALTAVSAERDEFKRLFSDCHPVHLDGVQRAYRAEAERDRLYKAITEALDLTRPGASVPLGVSEVRHIDRLMATAHGILRAALDKEGSET